MHGCLWEIAFSVFSWKSHRTKWYLETLTKCLLSWERPSFFFYLLTMACERGFVEKGDLWWSRDICLSNPRTEVSCPVLEMSPDNLPAPRAHHLFAGRVGQHPGRAPGLRAAVAGFLAGRPESAASSPWSRWTSPQGKEALLRVSCLHSSQMGFAIKSKLNSHCSSPPWSWHLNILPNTEGSRMFAAGPVMPATTNSSNILTCIVTYIYMYIHASCLPLESGIFLKPSSFFFDCVSFPFRCDTLHSRKEFSCWSWHLCASHGPCRPWRPDP